MSNTAAVMMTVNNDYSEGDKFNVQRQVVKVFAGERMACTCVICRKFQTTMAIQGYSFSDLLAANNIEGTGYFAAWHWLTASSIFQFVGC